VSKRRAGPEPGLSLRLRTLNWLAAEGLADVKWVFLLGLLIFTPWLTVHLKANPKHLLFA
jgi:hypothetical protein